MELPQPRPFGTQARKPTHDFLSLYSPAQQDPSATPSGGYLETHDFLQPLERVGKTVAKEGNKVDELSIGKSLPPVPPPAATTTTTTTTVEHILPGGIGTYSISHISCISQSQRMPKPEGMVINATQAQAQSSGSDKNDENSNCSSYTGSGFSLWEESVGKKGKTGKENIAGNRHVVTEGGMKIGGVPWMPSQSSSAHNHPTTTISSLSSSRPSVGQKNQSFVDMLKSAKNSLEDEDEEEEEFVIKKEPSSHYKIDTTHHEQKPNTPRSKHSATEQRRRSKINDRFSMLRELIPHGDQKRDKASFLLEVIQYIQFLQEKVNKYEDSCRGWTNEQPTITPWNNNQRPTEGFIDEPHQNGVPYTPNLNQNKHNSSLKKGQNTDKPSSFPSPLQQPNSRSCMTDCSVDKLKDQELTIQSGTISISSIYSQGLLSTLTQALQSSGVDLSQAKISVQIDLGKRATHDSSPPVLKKNEAPAIDETVARSRLASTREDNNALKRFKITRN